MKTSSRYAPLFSIGLILLVIVALIFVVTTLSTDSLGELRLKRLDWWVLPAIAVLHVLFLLLSAEVWRRVVRWLTRIRTGFAEAYLQVAMITVGKYVPGKVWGFIARAGQMHREQVPVHQSVTTGVIEQIMVLLGAVVVAAAAAGFVFPSHRVLVAGIGSLLLTLGFVAVANVPVLTRWVMQKRGLAGDPEPDRKKYDIAGLVKFSIAYALLWLISGVVLSIIYFALFDVAATAEQIAALILANTIGIVVGFFALFAPGGLGVREAVTTVVLTPFLPMREALLAAVAFRAWLVLFDGCNAVLLIISESRRARR